MGGKLIKEVKEEETQSFTKSLTNPSQALDALHFDNFFNAIRKGEELHSGILSGYQSTLLVQLGNIAQRSGTVLNIDPKTGQILNNPEAAKYWSRDYEKGWEPTL